MTEGPSLAIGLVRACMDLETDATEMVYELIGNSTPNEVLGAIGFLSSTVAEQWRQDARDMGISLDEWMARRALRVAQLAGD